jgi:threonine/homoserine/homoserine lactone efflux protein
VIDGALGQIAAFGPVAWYFLLMAGTPGPNNAMLAASGMNFGLARTWPHIWGIVGGLIVLLAACGFGLGVLIQALPHSKIVLAVIGSSYLVYLAWRIANAAAPTAAEGAKPLTFVEAFVFQFMNPKGWVMGLTAATMTPVLGGPLTTTLGLVIVGGLFGTPVMWVWVCFGAGLAKVFQNDRSRVWINRALAALLIVTIPFMFV